ncbi:MAG TPA: class I SAM-dependent rRNA methyltransferase [Terriglobales bacterium]|nr:class I SAM-dependent rRNA methyltransferase [Terriglobales bacterium]
MAPPPTADQVIVNARAIARLRAGHTWLYRSDILAGNGIAPGSLVRVVDQRGRLQGSALYSSASQIAVRMLSPGLVEDFPALLRQRLKLAFDYRERVVRDTDAYRLVFSEADFLPGLIVDRYNDVLTFQALTQAMDSEAVRQTLLATLVEQFSPAGIVERVEERVRELEQLPSRTNGLLSGNTADTVFTMNGVRFQYRGLAGQKTGAFLDQRENYAAAARYARGQALDVFCYQGGFALHLARSCSQVTGVDSSHPALELAEHNAGLNQPAREIEWIEGNAFDLLKDYSEARRQYDTIVLDPPAFARSRRNLETALRGYKELNLRALKMLRPGGVLVTCSCSYHVSESDFLQMVAAAAQDARRTLRLMERRGQAQDHPVLLGVPETSYLKCLILQADPIFGQ